MPERILYSYVEPGVAYPGPTGQYRAVLTMWRGTSRPVKEYRLNLGGTLVGDSHIRLTKPKGGGHLRAVLLDRRGRQRYELFATPNKKGFLAKLEVRPFEASDFDEAHKEASRAASAFLSRLSAQLDVPCMVFQIDLYRVGTSDRWTRTVNPYIETPLRDRPSVPVTSEFEAYASIYREAANSNSFLYQFLCLYKITEGIRARRIANIRATTRRGEPYKVPVEVVPVTVAAFAPWLRQIYVANPGWSEHHTIQIFRKEAIGKTFEAIVGKGTKLARLRNDIAHALSASRGKAVTNLDDRDFSRDVQEWLPLLKCIARRMLRNEFPKEFLAGLNSHLEGVAGSEGTKDPIQSVQ